MGVKKLYTVEAVVKSILEEEPYARKDDMYLYYKYCQNKIHPLSQKDFARIFQSRGVRKHYNISTFETVGRTRRKIQSKYPYLRDENVSEKRYEQQDMYIDYAMH